MWTKNKVECGVKIRKAVVLDLATLELLKERDEFEIVGKEVNSYWTKPV